MLSLIFLENFLKKDNFFYIISARKAAANSVVLTGLEKKGKTWIMYMKGKNI